MNNFSEKTAGEVQTLSFDFSEFLQPGEKIVYASVESRAAKSKDAEYKKFVSGNASVDGGIVSQKVAGGKADVSYKLTATVETNLKQVLKLSGNILVKADLDIDLTELEELEELEEVEEIEVIAEEVVVENAILEIVSDAADPIENSDPIVEGDLAQADEEALKVEEKAAAEIKESLFDFSVTETKEIVKDGSTYGVVAGYASTHGNVDRVKDRVMPGAFTKSIKQLSDQNRLVRMYYQHDAKEIIGGFPTALMVEDDQGLKVVGEINLEVQRGREVYALAKQGVLTDFSIGYSVKDYKMNKGIRELLDVELWEISVVAEPANPMAKILQVKGKVEKSDVASLKSIREKEQFLRDSGFSRSAAMFMLALPEESKEGVTQEEVVQGDPEQPKQSLAELLAELKSKLEQL